MIPKAINHIYLFEIDISFPLTLPALNKKRNHLGKCDKHMGTLFSSKKYIQQIPSLQLQSYIHHVPKETKSFPNFTNNHVI